MFLAAPWPLVLVHCERGADGAHGVLRTSAGRTLRGKGQQTIPRGETFVMEMPGGGGLGAPLQREPARVADDVRTGLVSAASAERDYGVVLTPSGDVDSAATDACRAARRREHA